MRKMKDSGVEWIGEIPENWDAVKLSYLFEIIGSGTTPTSTNSDYYDGEYNWLQTGDLNDKEITTTSKTITQKAVDDYSTLTLYNKGTIVMAMYGATIGKLGILNIDSYTNQACCAMSRPVNIQPKFVYYWLMCNKENIVNLSMGGGQLNISQGIISTLKITIPKDITKQNEIVKYLDKKCAEIDALIEAKEKTNALLKEQRQSIIYEAVTKGLNPDVPMKDSGIEWIGEIPESWEVCKIKHFAEGEDGVKIGPFGSALTNRLINDGDYNVYSQANLIGADFSKTNHTINEETFTQLNNYEVLPGDICVSMMGTIGKCKVVPDGIKPGIMDSHLIKIRLDSTVNPKFFEYVYDKDNSGVCFVQMKMESKGSIMDGLNSKIVKNLLFPLPPIEEQDFIVKYLEEKCGKYDSLIKANNTTIDSLKEYRKSIIFEAVTGKVEI